MISNNENIQEFNVRIFNIQRGNINAATEKYLHINDGTKVKWNKGQVVLWKLKGCSVCAYFMVASMFTYDKKEAYENLGFYYRLFILFL